MVHFLQSIDRRWIYLALIITLLISLLLGKPVDPVVLSSVQQLYDAVEAAPAGPDDGKIILIGTTFSSSTIGESGNQARAIMRHLMLKHKRFAVIAIAEPQGAVLGRQIPADLAKQYGYKYGEDWIALGYQLGALAFYKSFPRDIQKTVPEDAVEGKPLSSFKIMEKVKSIKDVAMLIEVSASSSVFYWIQIVQPTTTPRMKIGYACTGVMATEAYPFLDSGQLTGMLPGLKGAADYEKLVDNEEQRMLQAGEVKRVYDIAASDRSFMPRSARVLMYTQDKAHIMIIAFIILGNVGMVLARRRKRAVEKGETHG